MDPYYKYIATIIVVVIFVIALIFLSIKASKKHKRKVTIAVFLLFLSMVTNRSIYWFIYWDGPFYGHVVDAENGTTIGGANVAVTWGFEYNILFGSGLCFANATETVTDKDGKFFIPLTFTFFFYPLSTLEKMELFVFQPGYDSHPPALQRKVQQAKHRKYVSRDGKYRIGRYVSCEPRQECLVQLHKLKTIVEKYDVSLDHMSSYRSPFDITNPISRIPNYVKVTTQEFKANKKLLQMANFDFQEHFRQKYGWSKKPSRKHSQNDSYPSQTLPAGSSACASQGVSSSIVIPGSRIGKGSPKMFDTQQGLVIGAEGVGKNAHLRKEE